MNRVQLWVSGRRLDFCMKFCNYLAQHSGAESNLLFSPLCAEVALSLASSGARGITLEEINHVLELQEGSALEIVHQILIHLKQNEETFIPDDYGPVVHYKLFLSSGLFVEQQFPIKECFAADAERLCDAVCSNVQFAKHPDEAALAINEFVKEQTCGTIDNLVTATEFSEFTRLVSVNALYFKANWHCPFLEENTTSKPFTTARGDVVMVQTMHATRRCRYYKSKALKFKWRKVPGGPVHGKVLSCLLYSTGKKEALSAMVTGFVSKQSATLADPEKLQKAMQSLQPITYGTIQLPKFCIQQSIDMDDMLKSFGMKTAFDEKLADFTGISDRRLYLDKVKQKTYIDVNEKGTEASAAMQMTFKEAGLPPDTKCEFIADRPFMFMIRHKESGTVLFFGHVADPTVH